MKKLIKSAAFLLCLALVLGAVNQALRFKYTDGSLALETYRAQPANTIDVLALGSSHSFENVNTSVLWKEYGIAAFDLAGSVQPPSSTYYYLEEALKTQRPKVILVDMYVFSFEDDISESPAIKNTMGLADPVKRWEAVREVFAPEKQLEGFFLFPWYHTRYNELKKEDFDENLGYGNLLRYWKGFGDNAAVTPGVAPAAAAVTQEAPLTEKNEKYLRKIIELAQREKIPLVLMVTPYLGLHEGAQMRYNTAARIAREEGVPFWDFNQCYEEIGLGFSTDFADADHLNSTGSEKFAKYLGRKILDGYRAADHRGETAYESWEKSAKYFYQGKAQRELKSKTDIDGYLLYLKQMEDQFILLRLPENTAAQLEPETQKALKESMGLSDADIRAGGIFLIKNSVIEKRLTPGAPAVYYHVDDTMTLFMDGENGNIEIQRQPWPIYEGKIQLWIYDLWRTQTTDSIYLIEGDKTVYR